jgi:hypothetical protein
MDVTSTHNPKNFVQLLVFLFPNRIANATGDMLEFAVTP